MSLSVYNTCPACSPLQVMHFRGLAICDTAGYPRHWSQEQGLLDSWVLLWIIHIIVFFPSTQCGFSQSHTPDAFERSHHDSRGVEGSQKPQKDLVLRFKAAVVITPFYKEQYLMSTPPLLSHLTFQQAWEQVFKQSAGEQQEEQGSNLLSAWQNVPVARWAQEKAGPSRCWVGGTGKSMAFLRKRTAGLVGKPRPCSALSFISACRKSCMALLNHQWMPVPCEKFYPWAEHLAWEIPLVQAWMVTSFCDSWIPPLLQWENTIPWGIVLGPTSGFWAVGWKKPICPVLAAHPVPT